MYKHADAWGDVGFAAGTLTLAVEGECRTEPPERAIFSRIASLLERQNVPTQFLSREFANAVRRIQWIEPMLISGENKQQHKSGENKQ